MSDPPSDALTTWADHLEAALAAAGSTRRVRVYRRTASTQDAARKLAPGPVAVVADEQTGGRGRLGRRWRAAPGTGVLVSLTQPLTPPVESVGLASLAGAVAVAEAIESVAAGVRCEIKWPNDVLIDGRKAAGVLVETTGRRGRRAAVIGIGVNVADPFAGRPPSGLADTVTWVGAHARDASRLAVLTAVLVRFDTVVQTWSAGDLVAAWRHRSLMREHRVRLRHGGREVRGTVVDLDPDAGLILRADTGELVHLPAATTTTVVDADRRERGGGH